MSWRKTISRREKRKYMLKSATKMLFVLMLTLVVAASLPARTFQFTDIGAGDAYTITGTLTGTSNGNGWFTLTSGSGSYDGDPFTFVPGTGTSPSGAFYYDSLMLPGSQPAFNDGPLFLFSDNRELNIWGSSPGSYSTWIAAPDGQLMLQDNGSTFAITGQTPEPGTLAMFAVGLGLACLGVWRRRKAVSNA